MEAIPNYSLSEHSANLREASLRVCWRFAEKSLHVDKLVLIPQSSETISTVSILATRPPQAWRGCPNLLRGASVWHGGRKQSSSCSLHPPSLLPLAFTVGFLNVFFGWLSNLCAFPTFHPFFLSSMSFRWSFFSLWDEELLIKCDVYWSQKLKFFQFCLLKSMRFSGAHQWHAVRWGTGSPVIIVVK